MSNESNVNNLELPQVLNFVEDKVYRPNNMQIHDFRIEVEGKAYGACNFRLNLKNVCFRVGKITPRKEGYFVTFWKRSEAGPIRPYDLNDVIDLFVVNVEKDGMFGQFVFPKAELFKRGVLAKEGVGGRLAIRVYSPWDTAKNKQAKVTQAWQVLYFYQIHLDGKGFLLKAQELYR